MRRCLDLAIAELDRQQDKSAHAYGASGNMLQPSAQEWKPAYEAHYSAGGGYSSQSGGYYGANSTSGNYYSSQGGAGQTGGRYGGKYNV